MRVPLADVATAAGIALLAAVGGAFALYAERDDSPGGVLIGLLLVVGSAALALRAIQRGR